MISVAFSLSDDEGISAEKSARLKIKTGQEIRTNTTVSFKNMTAHLFQQSKWYIYTIVDVSKTRL